MTAEHLLANLGWRLVLALQDVDDCPALGAVESEGILAAWHRDLLDILAELDSRVLVDLDKLVDTSQRRLLLTRNEMRSDSKAINFMALLVQAKNSFLVDVVRCHDSELGEPRQVVMLSDTNKV